MISAPPSRQMVHQQFITDLGETVQRYSALTEKPIEVDLLPPLPPRIRAYIFNATSPDIGGRPEGEYKIVLTAPGQMAGQRGDFDHTGDRHVLLIGYVDALRLYILWDAGLYFRFSYNRNVQVTHDAVTEGLVRGITTSLKRNKLAGVTEEIVIAQAEYLADAIRERWDLTLNRLTSGGA